MDRAPCALCPKGSTAQPRDIICCIHDYTLKERIMAKAKAQCTIDFAGASIQLYPDLSWPTLQKLRHIRPLLALLKEHGFAYIWGFPFAQ